MAVWEAPVAQLLLEVKQVLYSLGGARVTHGARKGAVAEKVRFVAVCYSAAACDLVGVRARAGPADQAAHSSTGHAEHVADWMAPVAQMVLEANQIVPSSTT